MRGDSHPTTYSVFQFNKLTHVGHVHNVNNGALCAVDLTFVLWFQTPTGYSES